MSLNLNMVNDTIFSWLVCVFVFFFLYNFIFYFLFQLSSLLFFFCLNEVLKFKRKPLPKLLDFKSVQVRMILKALNTFLSPSV